MIDTRRIISTIIDYGFGVFLSLSFVYTLTASLNFVYKPQQILAIISIVTLVCCLAFYNKLTLKISGIVFAVLLLAGTPFVVSKGLHVRFSSHAFNTVSWLYNYIDEAVELHSRYAYTVLLFLSIVVSIFVYIFTVKKFNFYFILIAGMALFTVQWMLEYFVSYTSFYLYLVLVVAAYIRYVLVKSSGRVKNRYLNASQFMLWALPVCVAVVIISTSLPYSNKPIEWPWLDEKVMTFSSYINNGFTNQYSKFDYFSVNATGFGDNSGNLGGKVRLDKTRVLQVQAPRSVYLKAVAKETYTGTSWLGADTEKLPLDNQNNSLNYDVFEMKKGMKLLTWDDDLLDKYFFKDTVTITYENLRTKSLFLPVKTESIIFVEKEPNNVSVSSNSAVTSANTLTKRVKYSLEAYNGKYGDEEFKNLLRRTGRGFYSHAESRLLYRNRDINLNGNRVLPTSGVVDVGPNIPISLYEIRVLRDKSREVYSKYLQTPENLPRRVNDQAMEIVLGANNTYDMVKAIEQHLSNNYKYTLTPMSTPKGKDFVDYFLFESKEGYCTYYASAMTVMLRCVGIPARYVEGYMMPSAPDEGMTYYITNERAHAWVEVYFEGFGWVPFEPTTSFTSSFYSNATTPSLGGSVDTIDEEPSPIPEEDLLDVEISDTELGNYNTEEDYNRILVIGSVIALIAVILCTVGVNAFRNRLEKWKMRRMQPRDSILALYIYFVKLLKMQGLEVKPGETPLQYAERVDNFRAFTHVRFKAITERFVIARYSNESISESDKKTVYEFHKELETSTMRELGKFRYFLYKFLIGKV